MDPSALSDLQLDESSPRASVPPPRRRWVTRLILPVVILLFMAIMLGYSARHALWPAPGIDVVTVVAREQDAAQPGVAADHTASVSVQAPGWLEPDPYPTYVTALTDGIIQRVLVLEGETIEAGQVVAEMVEDDARIALEAAQAELSRRKASLAAAQADWQHPIALQRAVAVNQALLAEARADEARLDAQITQQQAKLKELSAAYERVARLLPNAAAELEVEQAQFQLDAQRALVDATRKQRPLIDARVQRYVAEVTAAQADLELRIHERKRLDEATATVAAAAAAAADAELRLRRMKIVSPVAGVVMTRLVAPGSKIMLAMDSVHSAHVVHLYDPRKLQVRVDVPLADAAKVGVGQRARVVVDVLTEQQFAGQITRFVHQADISKNTVEVKVAIEDPSPLLKPDILTRVKFLATDPAAAGGAAPAAGLTVFVPRTAVRGDGREAHVWVVSAATSRLRKQNVTVGSPRDDDWLVVFSGLQPGDVLAADPSNEFVEGQRVQPLKPTARPHH